MKICVSAITSSALSLLAACGSSGTASDEGLEDNVLQTRNSPIPTVMQIVPEGYHINYGSGFSFLTDNPALDFGSFGAGGTSSGEMVFQSGNGDARVTLTRDNMESTGVSFERLGPTALIGGSLTYQGDYISLVTNEDTGDVVYIINGIAAFDVDMDMGDVTGDITNRTVLGPSGDVAIGVTAAPVALTGSVNGQGFISGTTTGGDISALSDTVAQPGTMDGLIAGATSDYVVGGLDMVHVRSGSDYHEEGAFIAGN